MKTNSLRWRIVGSITVIILLFAAVTYGMVVYRFENYYQDDIFDTLSSGHKAPAGRIARLEGTGNLFDIRNIIELNYIKFDETTYRALPLPGDAYVPRELKQLLQPELKKAKGGTQEFQLALTIPAEGDGADAFGISEPGDYQIYGVITRTKLRSDSTQLSKEDSAQIRNRVDRIIRDMDLVEEGQVPSKNVRALVSGSELLHVSVKGVSLESDLQKTMFMQLGIGLLIAGLAVVLLLLWISKRMITPLETLTAAVTRMRQRRFEEPIQVQGSDEIGILAGAIEEMRAAIERHEREQQFKLHAISHELKTPIMVIKSYLDAVQNGVYPKGSLEGTVQVALDESNRLEKLVHEMLNLQRIDYLSDDQSRYEVFRLDELIEDVMYPYQKSNPDLHFQLGLECAEMYGNPELIQVVIENLLENQVRYARTMLTVQVTQGEGKTMLQIGNDGPPIEGLREVFEPFKKSSDGGFGLGLYIVRRIVETHRGDIRVSNTGQGVVFDMTFTEKG